MTDGIHLSDEQFDRLMARVGSGAVGVGGAPSTQSATGMGCGGSMGCGADVFTYLSAGFPCLALAAAYGIPFAPYIINIKAEFSDDTVSYIPNVGSDVKIVQDTVVDSVLVRCISENPPLNVFSNQSDYYANFQNNITATLDVQGAPRYSIAPKFTPLATLCDAFNGNSKWPNCWILTYQQQLSMSFQANVALQNTPLDVWVTFRTRVPTSEKFVGGKTTPSEAIAQLQSKFGVVVPQAYADWACR
jgi:hypothetical protein